MKKMVKGFTLIELIVVVAIIGVLAAILIPSLTGYINDAQKAADVENARMIYEQAQLVRMTDYDADESYYAHGKIYRNGQTVYNVHHLTSISTVTADGESYKVGVVALTAGNKLGLKNRNDNFRAFVSGGNSECNTFVEKLNEQMGFNWQTLRGQKTVAVKMSHKAKVGNYVTGCYYICTRVDSKNCATDTMEIWAGNSRWDSNGAIMYRLWPSPDSYYSD